jgi:FkbM family methyltransferase
MELSQHYLTFPFYVPRVVFLVRNWPQYFFNYIFRLKRPTEYRFRNGSRLIDPIGTLAGTIAVIFVRREYGSIRNFRTIIDVGANMGGFALFAAKSCPEATIYCYEPEQNNFSTLTRNITVNHLQNRVSAFQCAVASSSGPREIAVNLSPLHSLFTTSKGGRRQSINCVTLSEIIKDLSLEKIDLLKMNCEGAEYEIFGNCAQEHLDRIHNIRLEYHELDAGKNNGDSLCRLLEKGGFIIERFTRYKGESGFIWACRS